MADSRHPARLASPIGPDSPVPTHRSAGRLTCPRHCVQTPRIGVPGTPLVMTWRRVASLTSARYTGSARDTAAPPLPSAPWQAEQFCL